jgi:manganese/iron transport system permease protein/iron/zinc/copper transport system permease protein
VSGSVLLHAAISLSEPFRYEFFVNGLIVASLAGALCGLVGVYIVLRNMSYIGHGMSHAVFGGAVASYMLSVNFYLGAGLWGLLAALLINGVSRRGKIGADAAIGIVTTASFAVGVALISRGRRFTRNFEAALFGNILGVRRSDLFVVAAAFIFTLAVIVFRYRALMFLTFDNEVASVYGVRTGRLETLFAVVLAVAVISTLQILGATLVAAALVIPAVIARLCTDRFAPMLWIATLTGAACGFVGMYSSYYTNVASGATIVLTAAAVFIVVFAVQGVRARLLGRETRLASVRSGVPVEPVHLG